MLNFTWPTPWHPEVRVMEWLGHTEMKSNSKMSWSKLIRKKWYERPVKLFWNVPSHSDLPDMSGPSACNCPIQYEQMKC